MKTWEVTDVNGVTRTYTGSDIDVVLMVHVKACGYPVKEIVKIEKVS